ncbi:MAG: sulfite exporter TauE/SafE family protein [Myxococcales bacterium]|nr:sulfite exporter TauE/SafE family protein [Myxococcales bacterium]
MILGAVVAGAAAGLASLPHCAGMCGPLAAFAGRDRRSSGLYLAGRFVSYVSLGALAGAFGSTVVGWMERPIAQAMLSWTLGLGLALTAWRLWRGGASRPAKLVTLRTKDEARRAAWRAPLLGAMTGFLPCGALAAALLLAAGSGDALSGGATLFAFATASAPALLGAGVAASYLRRAGETPRKLLSVALALGAILLLLRPVDALRGEPTECHSRTPIGASFGDPS